MILRNVDLITDIFGSMYLKKKKEKNQIVNPAKFLEAQLNTTAALLYI